MAKIDITSYLTFGDTRPPVETLRAMADSCHYVKLGSLLMLNDVYIDLAMHEPEQADRHIGSAAQTLDTIELLATPTSDNQEQNQHNNAVRAAVCLQRFELGNWNRAARGVPLELDYEDMLRAGFYAQRLLYPSNDIARIKLLEFMPVLLGARQKYHNQEAGWFGRLALSREEKRSNLPDDANPNWDTGIILSDSPESYNSPEVKLSVKSRLRNFGVATRKKILNSTAAYRRAGIQPISARKCGFEDPKTIILSCMDEIEILPPRIRRKVSLTTPEQLDSITESIRQDIFSEPERQ